jgi:uncharacterized membrane protein HdeD (DUF308 family)
MIQREKKNIPDQGLPGTSRVKYQSDWKSRTVAHTYNVRPIHVISAVIQLLFGKLVVAIALLGFINPIWMAAIVNVLGCAVVVVGGFQLYDAFTDRSAHKSLVRDAMRRVIDFRN